MSTAKSLLKASVVGSTAFALPWLRLSHLASSGATVLRVFIGYGVLILLLSMIVGFPFVFIAERLKLVRWWFFTLMGIVLGASLGGVLTVGGIVTPDPDAVSNPFAITFSPFTRNSPGFVDSIPLSAADFAGSAGLGAIVGAALGASFWFFYSRGPRPNNRFERSRVASSEDQGGSR
jgi:hypothetical protein